MTLLSRILGFARESVIARVFGVSAATDAFYVAFRIPNFLRQLFSEGAFATAFVPVLSEYKAKRTPEELKELVDHVAGTLAAVLLVLTALGVLGAEVLITIFAPGYWNQPEKYRLACELLRITFPYILFVSLTGLAAGVLNTHRRFAVPALTPILLNLAMIAAALLLTPYFAEPITALAVGVFLGGVIQLLVQIPALKRLNLLPRPIWGWHYAGVQRVIKLMIPTMFGASVAQINLLVDTIIATALMTGTVSWLYQADRLIQFPQGVFGVALATVILPHLSGRHAKEDHRGFSRSLDWGLRTALVIAVPAMVSLVVLAEPVLWSVFGYGKYTARDVQMAAWSLSTLALGLPAFVCVKVLAPGFFSRMDTKSPVRAGIASMVANIVLNALLVGAAFYFGFVAPHAGMGVASALAGYLHATLLYRWLRRDQVYQPEPGWGKFALQLGTASLVLIAVFYLGLHYLHAWPEWRALQRFAAVFALLGAGGVAFLGTLYALGLKPRALLDKSHG